MSITSNWRNNVSLKPGVLNSTTSTAAENIDDTTDLVLFATPTGEKTDSDAKISTVLHPSVRSSITFDRNEHSLMSQDHEPERTPKSSEECCPSSPTCYSCSHEFTPYKNSPLSFQSPIFSCTLHDPASVSEDRRCLSRQFSLDDQRLNLVDHYNSSSSGPSTTASSPAWLPTELGNKTDPSDALSFSNLSIILSNPFPFAANTTHASSFSTTETRSPLSPPSPVSASETRTIPTSLSSPGTPSVRRPEERKNDTSGTVKDTNQPTMGPVSISSLTEDMNGDIPNISQPFTAPWPVSSSSPVPSEVFTSSQSGPEAATSEVPFSLFPQTRGQAVVASAPDSTAQIPFTFSSYDKPLFKLPYDVHQYVSMSEDLSYVWQHNSSSSFGTDILSDLYPAHLHRQVSSGTTFIGDTATNSSQHLRGNSGEELPILFHGFSMPQAESNCYWLGSMGGQFLDQQFPGFPQQHWELQDWCFNDNRNGYAINNKHWTSRQSSINTLHRRLNDLNNCEDIPNDVRSSLMVFYVPKSWTVDRLRMTFEKYGKVLQYRLDVDNPASGDHKGRGFVQFDTPEAAQRALIGTDGLLVEEGRRLKVQMKRYVPSWYREVSRAAHQTPEKNNQQQKTVQDVDNAASCPDHKQLISSFLAAVDSPEQNVHNTNERMIKKQSPLNGVDNFGISSFAPNGVTPGMSTATQVNGVTQSNTTQTQGVVPDDNELPIIPENNVFVFHIPPDWDDGEFLLQFSRFGTIRRLNFPKDDSTPWGHRGYGFICYDRHEAAIKAIRKMNGKEVLQGRRLKVEFKKPRRNKWKPVYQKLNVDPNSVSFNDNNNSQMGGSTLVNPAETHSVLSVNCEPFVLYEKASSSTLNNQFYDFNNSVSSSNHTGAGTATEMMCQETRRPGHEGSYVKTSKWKQLSLPSSPVSNVPPSHHSHIIGTEISHHNNNLYGREMQKQPNEENGEPNLFIKTRGLSSLRGVAESHNDQTHDSREKSVMALHDLDLFPCLRG